MIAHRGETSHRSWLSGRGPVAVSHPKSIRDASQAASVLCLATRPRRRLCRPNNLMGKRYSYFERSERATTGPCRRCDQGRNRAPVLTIPARLSTERRDGRSVSESMSEMQQRLIRRLGRRVDLKVVLRVSVDRSRLSTRQTRESVTPSSVSFLGYFR